MKNGTFFLAWEIARVLCRDAPRGGEGPTLGSQVRRPSRAGELRDKQELGGEPLSSTEGASEGRSCLFLAALQRLSAVVCVCACVRVCACARVRVRVRARACACACARSRARVLADRVFGGRCVREVLVLETNDAAEVSSRNGRWQLPPGLIFDVFFCVFGGFGPELGPEGV